VGGTRQEEGKYEGQYGASEIVLLVLLVSCLHGHFFSRPACRRSNHAHDLTLSVPLHVRGCGLAAGMGSA